MATRKPYAPLTLARSGPGVLADDGVKVQCHECGLWFRALVTHLARIHHMSTDEYREKYGLARTLGLMSEASRQQRHSAGLAVRDRDPLVLAVLHGKKATAMRAEPYPSRPKRASTGLAISESRRVKTAALLTDRLAETGWADLAEAVEATRATHGGWTALARQLRVSYTWLKRVGNGQGLQLEPVTSSAGVSKQMVDVATHYAATHGDLDVPATWIDPATATPLGQWLVKRRNHARNRRTTSWITEQLDQLDPQWRQRGRRR